VGTPFYAYKLGVILMATIAKKLITNDHITFNWADETSTKVAFADFSDAMNTRATQHGYSQKLGDSYSGAKSIGEAKACFNSVLNGLLGDDWNQGGGSTGGIMVEALAKVAGATFEEALEAWNGYDDDKRKALAKDPQVKLAKAEIELARAKAKVTESDDEFTL
jgi:hypothetical protein